MEADLGILIRPFADGDKRAVIELWSECGLLRPWNNPELDIARKIKVNPELFLVGVLDGKVVASAMGGYEGHRGWVNYLAVNPDCRMKGCGRRIMQEIEKRLLELGCPKLNLQVRDRNMGALEFYRRTGFQEDKVVSMGKRLITDPEKYI